MIFISPTTWDDAVDKIGDKTPIGSLLDSQDWSDMPLALRERAFFSSEIENVRFLQSMRDGITDFLSSSVETLPNGQTALAMGSRQQFIKDYSDLAVRMGLGPLDAGDAGTLKDIRSEGRLGLIFDTMTQSAHDYTYWRQGMDPDILDAFPAQRFIRERDVKTPRTVHQQNEGVVRLKSDLGFWMAMNDPSFGGFGVPWGPWGFNSGMGVDDVEREEAEATGILKKGERVQPVEKEFNDKLEASARGLDDDMLAKLKENFGDQIQIEGDTVKWVSSDEAKPGGGPAPEPAPETKPAPESDTLEGVLSNLGLDADQKATVDDMTDLKDQLKESEPVKAQSAIKYIRGAQPSGALTDERIQSVVQEFLDYLPSETARALPPLKIEVLKSSRDLGQYGMGGMLTLNNAVLGNDPDRARRTIFHELAHWLHRDGDQEYRDLIQKHFEDRTAGERVKRLPGYARGVIGKTDDWYEVYAGRIYPFEFTAGGLEVPTRYMEWLTFAPDKMAELWNNPSFRETMKVVLQGLF